MVSEMTQIELVGAFMVALVMFWLTRTVWVTRDETTTTWTGKAVIFGGLAMMCLPMYLFMAAIFPWLPVF